MASRTNSSFADPFLHFRTNRPCRHTLRIARSNSKARRTCWEVIWLACCLAEYHACQRITAEKVPIANAADGAGKVRPDAFHGNSERPPRLVGLRRSRSVFFASMDPRAPFYYKSCSAMA